MAPRGLTFLHTSDWHLGRSFFSFDLIDDQRHVLNQIVELAKAHRVDAIIIAGDVFDSSQPPADALSVMDEVLTELCHVAPVLMVAGNHDLPERLAYGASLFRRVGLYIGAKAEAPVRSVDLSDAFGPIRFDLLPYVRASATRRVLNDEAIASCDDAVSALLATTPQTGARAVLVAHQYVAGSVPVLDDGGMRKVGGSDPVSPSVFDAYSYVALGHLHSHQTVGSDRIVYSGAPLAYSFHEADQTKGVCLIEMGPNGIAQQTFVPLMPKHKVLAIETSLADALASDAYDRDAYVHVTLTDKVRPLDVMARLRVVFPFLAQLDQAYVVNDEEAEAVLALTKARGRAPYETFLAFFEDQTGQSLTADQTAWLKEAFRDAGAL